MIKLNLSKFLLYVKLIGIKRKMREKLAFEGQTPNQLTCYLHTKSVGVCGYPSFFFFFLVASYFKVFLCQQPCNREVLSSTVDILYVLVIWKSQVRSTLTLLLNLVDPLIQQWLYVHLYYSYKIMDLCKKNILLVHLIFKADLFNAHWSIKKKKL